MKNPYLMTHILSHLHSCARIYDKDRIFIRTYRHDSANTDDPFCEMLVQDPLLRNYDADSQLPLLFSVNEVLVYAWIPIAENYCLLGPVRLAEKIDFLHRLRCPELPNNCHDAPLPSYDHIPCCGVGVLAEDILLLYHIEHLPQDGRPQIEPRQLIYANTTYPQITQKTMRRFYEKVFSNIEYTYAHSPYSHEYREISCIRRGDVEELRHVMEEKSPTSYGKLSKDPIRQRINIGIVSVTLACRAAIEAGLHYETSYSLSDAYIQQMDACTDPMTIDYLYYDAKLQFAKLVRDLLVKKEEDTPTIENRHISHCKDYIFAHLHDKLTVQAIAKDIGLDPNYLSALFHEKEKVPLKQYIIHEKIRIAKNMIAYTHMPYAEISLNLGFSSQSHMGKEFKRITGLTPSAYRLEHSLDDFVSNSMKSST